MNDSKTLGRGLSSLIQNNSDPQARPSTTNAPYFPKTTGGAGAQILNLDINQIKINPHQPRTDFNEAQLNNLANSIKEHGILQPLTVTQTLAGEYELVAGERRLRASKLAGLKKVPAILRSAKELEKLELSLIENIQRQDLNPIEKAISYKKLIDNFNLTHEQAAVRMGISRAQFSNTIRLLSLPSDIQRGLANQKISMGQAKVLLEVKDDSKREMIYKRASQTKQTVEDTKKQVNQVKVKTHTRQVKKDPGLKQYEAELQQKLQTKVNIRQRGSWGGVIQIEFYSEEELKEIVNRMKG